MLLIPHMRGECVFSEATCCHFHSDCGHSLKCREDKGFTCADRHPPPSTHQLTRPHPSAHPPHQSRTHPHHPPRPSHPFSYPHTHTHSRRRAQPLIHVNPPTQPPAHTHTQSTHTHPPNFGASNSRVCVIFASTRFIRNGRSSQSRGTRISKRR